MDRTVKQQTLLEKPLKYGKIVSFSIPNHMFKSICSYLDSSLFHNKELSNLIREAIKWAIYNDVWKKPMWNEAKNYNDENMPSRNIALAKINRKRLNRHCRVHIPKQPLGRNFPGMNDPA